MKIEHPRTHLEPTRQIAADAGHTPARAVPAPGADAVRLSPDLQLVDRAVRAAAADEDRPERVARARELYDRGELGVDVERLADRMIDALTHSDDKPA